MTPFLTKKWLPSFERYWHFLSSRLAFLNETSVHQTLATNNRTPVVSDSAFRTCRRLDKKHPQTLARLGEFGELVQVRVTPVDIAVPAGWVCSRKEIHAFTLVRVSHDPPPDTRNHGHHVSAAVEMRFRDYLSRVRKRTRYAGRDAMHVPLSGTVRNYCIHENRLVKLNLHSSPFQQVNVKSSCQQP